MRLSASFETRNEEKCNLTDEAEAVAKVRAGSIAVGAGGDGRSDDISITNNGPSSVLFEHEKQRRIESKYRSAYTNKLTTAISKQSGRHNAATYNNITLAKIVELKFATRYLPTQSPTTTIHGQDMGYGI